MTKLKIKVVPGAKRNAIVGWLGDALKVAVSAPPEGGKANVAVIALLAETLDLDSRTITVVTGPTQPRKTIGISGLTSQQLAERLLKAGIGSVSKP